MDHADMSLVGCQSSYLRFSNFTVERGKNLIFFFEDDGNVYEIQIHARI